MSQRHTVSPRVMCFIFYEDEVLLLKASKKKEWTGMYDPVGGHIERGESVIAAAKREIKEETNLTVDNAKLRGIVHVSNFFDKNVMMFVTASYTTSKQVQSNEEGELEWINIKNLDKLNIFEDVKPILKHVLEMKETEIFVGASEFDGKDKLLSLDIKIN